MKMMKELMRKRLLSIVLFFFTVGMGSLSTPLEVLSQIAPSKTEAEKTEKTQKVTSPEAPAVIPVPEIAARAAEVANLLRDVKAQVAPDKQIDSIRTLLPEKAGQISRQSQETKAILEGAPNLGVLQAQQQLWQRNHADMKTWLQMLTGRAMLLRGEQEKLSKLKKIWSKTRGAGKSAKAPQTVIQQVDDLLKAIETERTYLESQLKSVLDLQGLVVREKAICTAALDQIAEAQQNSLRDITARDSIPIWIPVRWSSLATSFPERLRELIPTWLEEMSKYVRDPAMGLPLHIGLFMGLAIVFWAARRRVRRWKTSGEDISPSLIVFERPFAAAFLVALGVASGPYSETTPIVKVIMEILFFAPMIRVIKPVVNARFLPELYTLWFLFVIDSFRQALSGGQFSGQFILIIETLAGVTVLLWSLMRGQIRHSSAQGSPLFWKSAMRAGAVLILITLLVAAVAGVLGYVNLARILASEVVAGATMALGLYAALKILMGIVAFSLRVWPLGRLYMAVRHRGLLERKTHRVLMWAVVVLFVVRLLDYTGFLSPTLSFLKTLLSFKFERGSVSISVEDILAFIVTVWAAYLLSAVLRFILQEDVYPRIGVQKGMAYATSSLINYIILTLGFVVGLGVIGVSLTKMTVLAGAFGVGIGFGLQSIVNNFVSGLILLFERPLHVGDTIEVGDISGEVRRIGIRASTVRTFRGADIVVPNADLVTKQVTNWTLGDKLRRLDLSLVVNYGVDPEEVIQIFERVAKTHPDVLPSPAPSAFFTGYGDKSINFNVRAWTDKLDKFPRIRSELVTIMYHACHEAGIIPPFSQRGVTHSQNPDEGAAERPQSESVLSVSHPDAGEDVR